MRVRTMGSTPTTAPPGVCRTPSALLALFLAAGVEAARPTNVVATGPKVAPPAPAAVSTSAC
eukprot:7024696-Lingulodinium_polyedra.AAC.1